MAASSEIRFKIGGDTSALSRAFVAAESVAAAAGKQLEKKFSLKDSMKSSVLALGLSIEKIAEKIAATFTGGAPEAWRASLDAANDSARLIEESTRRRMSTLRQISDIEKQIARRAGDEDATPKTLPNTFLGGGAKFFDAIGAKNVAASFRRANVETPAEAAARAATATRDRLADEAKIAELKDRETKNQERIAEARREIDRLGLGTEEKIAAASEDAARAEEALEAARLKGAETAELELTYLPKVKTVRQALIENAKTTADFYRKEAEEKRKDEAEELAAIEKLSTARGKAARAVNEADQAAQLARRDALAFTVEEAASGKRGTPTDRVQARAIQRDEATARRLADSGRTVTQFDFTTGRNVQRGAAFFQSRAEQLRGNLGNAKTNEQKPFAGTEERLDTAIDELQALNDKLAPESIN